MSQVSTLTRDKKVAMLLLAMGKPLAGQVLRHFTADELRLIPRFSAGLDRISGPEFESLVEEFSREFANGLKFVGTSREVEELIFGALTPEQMAEINAVPAAEALEEPPWERLSGLGEQVLAGFISGEHPQVASTVLSRISPDASARVMAVLDARQRRDAMGRMLSVESVCDQALAILERTLSEELLSGTVRASGSESRSRLASIINKLDQAQADETLDRLAEQRPEDAKALRGLLFNFSDLPRLSVAARTMLLDKVPTDRLVLSLRGTDPTFQDMALSSLSPRSRRMVEAELKSGQPLPQREIRAAQRGIADLALAMAARGEIELNPDASAEIP